MKTRDELHKILSINTGKAFEQINKDCDRDHWLDADAAIEYGLADALFEGFDS